MTVCTDIPGIEERHGDDSDDIYSDLVVRSRAESFLYTDRNILTKVGEDKLNPLAEAAGRVRSLAAAQHCTGGASAAAAPGAIAAGAAGGTALGAGFGAMDSESWKDEFGIPEDFVQQVSVLIQPGDSAIYAILRVGNPDIVADQFKGY